MPEPADALVERKRGSREAGDRDAHGDGVHARHARGEFQGERRAEKPDPDRQVDPRGAPVVAPDALEMGAQREREAGDHRVRGRGVVALGVAGEPGRKRKPEAERYRIPEKMRGISSYQSRQSWANKATQFEMVGRTGINSCSPVGPGGWTGCTQQLINQAFKENREENEANTPDL